MVKSWSVLATKLVAKTDQDSRMKVMKDNILSNINSLEGETLNFKEIVIKNLYNKNEKLRKNASDWRKVTRRTSLTITFWNNAVLSSISVCVSVKVLEESVISVLADIDIFVKRRDIYP